MKTARLLLFIALLFLPVLVFPQQTFTLEQCIAKAVDNNLRLKQQKLSIRMSKADVKQSKFDLLPSVNAQAGLNYNFGRSLDPTTYQFVERRVQTSDVSLSSDWTLFNGLKKINNMKKSQLDLKADQSSYAEMKNNITLNVVSSFLRVLVREKEHDLAEQKLSFSKDQIERTKKLVDAGSQPEGELEEVRSQMLADKHQLTVADNQLEMARLDLKQLMELEPDDTLRIDVPESLDYKLTDVDKRNPQSIYKQAINEQPSIKSAEFQIESAKKGIAIAKANFYPSLSAFYNIRTNYSDANEEITGTEFTGGIDTVGFVRESRETVVRPAARRVREKTPFETQVERNLRQQVGLTLNIPIFNKWQTRTAVSKSRIDLANSRLQLRQKKNQLEKDIHEAYTQAKAAAQQLQSAKQSVEASEKSFSYAEKRFEQGAISSYEFTSAKNQLNNAKSNLIQAKYDYIFKLKILDYYQGKDIKLN